MKKTPVFDKILISFSILIIIPKKLSFDVLSSDFHEADGGAASVAVEWECRAWCYLHSNARARLATRRDDYRAAFIVPIMRCRSCVMFTQWLIFSENIGRH